MEAVLIDYMGSDARVVNAARVSFAKEIPEDVLEGSDIKLISYLAKHNHWTPFSHVQITMREKVPIFVARQRFKHMVGFTYNEVSRRYVNNAPEFYIPSEWRGKPDNAKQGSSDKVIDFVAIDDQEVIPIEPYYKNFLKKAQAIYEDMIAGGVAPEQARMVLPQSLYTEYYCTGSLAAWARAYRLRADSHAQREIQDLAGMWNGIISGIPELAHSWKALTE